MPLARPIRLAAALIAASTVTPALADPTLVGGRSDSRCLTSLHLAEAAFRSTSGSMLWPIPAPATRGTRIVLAPTSRDISGGNAIEADAGTFTIIHGATGEPTTFWATGLSGGRRLVVVEEPFNWRGDWYFTYLVDRSMTPQLLASAFGKGDAGLKPLLGPSRWNPPLVLKDSRSGQYWLIDRGEPYEVMRDWAVHGFTKGAMTTSCRISFGYGPRSDVSTALPAVRRLAAALDQALGPGTGEGTLQQTAALRNAVAHEWANASLRPWALTDAPYNSRGEVDRGLAEWASGVPARQALLRRIEAGYPAAERALGRYYAERFPGRGAPARMARDALDHMFRSYFVFSKRRT